jgi:putative transposase
MRKTFTYRISPKKDTEQKLFWTLDRCRELYNAALSERKDAYKYAGKSISYYDQQNDLPEIKAEIREEDQDIAAHVLQDVCYQILVFEDLQTFNLTRKPKPKQDENGKYLPNGARAKGGLNTSILDAGWGTFVHTCSVKAAWAGRTWIKVDARFTSQMCSGCGQVRKKDLSERWHTCDCGTELDRDVNAAINILERGRRQQGNL